MGDDEYTWINMNKRRLNVENPEIKEKYLKKKQVKNNQSPIRKDEQDENDDKP